MKQKSTKHDAFNKVVNEIYVVPKKHGGGTVKIEAWEDQGGNIVKYSMAYINPLIFADDHGRIIGYDNTHEYHHKHYLGETFPVEDFTSYEDLVERFEQEIQAFLKRT
jgi:hypothetical protein